MTAPDESRALIDRRIDILEKAILEMREDLEEISVTLRGPRDEIEKQYRPGLTSIVYSLHQDAQKKKAVTGFLLSVVSLLGVTNLIVIATFVFNLLSGAP